MTKFLADREDELSNKEMKSELREVEADRDAWKARFEFATQPGIVIHHIVEGGWAVSKDNLVRLDLFSRAENLAEAVDRAILVLIAKKEAGNKMSGPIDKDVCARLWNIVSLSVSQVRAVIREPKGDVQFLGFADIHIFVGDIPLVALPHSAIKLIHGRLHFDPQSIEGKGEKLGSFFPTWRPESAEARIVLTELLKNCPEIKALIKIATPDRAADV